MNRMTASQRADQVLESQIARAIERKEPRLPTVREMAGQSRVSVVTMWKAVRRFCEAGRLSAERGRWIEATGVTVPVREDDAPAATGTKWRRTVERIRHDLLAGRFLPGASLPSVKELAGEYRISPRTLRRSLADLIRQNLLVDRGGAYAAVAGPVSRTHSTLMLIAHADSDRPEMIGFYSPTFHSLPHQLETECRRRNVILEIVPYHSTFNRLYLPRYRANLLERPERHKDIIGFHVWPVGTNHQANLLSLLHRLRMLGKRVCILDESGDIDLLPVCRSSSLFSLFTIPESEQAGFNVGAMLLSRGLSHIAYFSPLHRHAWSRKRLDGLVRAARTFGGDAQVHPFVRVDEHDLDAWDPSTEETGCRRAMEKALERGRTRSSPALLREATDLVLPGVSVAVNSASCRRSTREQCRSALTDPRITAWVGANDETALTCLEFLRARPDAPRIAVVGFDNTLEALLHGLTSYSFNTAAVVSAMLDVSLGGGPLGNRRPVSTGPTDIPGIIVERASSRSVHIQAHQRRDVPAVTRQ